ncbi:eukaryotic cytochrome b561-domain-containing protein [Pseudomassariella vexata]|uniref:Eukaryotic cytochrome b561-domain-containing protein n=1 Tax=Pseudomassariella vexata TaxID=1141098 RepID=A0A1Y2DXJ7_9PEZI|nr:eukaryotic cytochrome b561-domain-containing protein [Pseudomassariella vexata]ORY64028.1 eukaryotic cytochrome b561-domain-containing protein [Pseudomassariella vexata]
MASATGIPQHTPGTESHDEMEPLLGRPGDVCQKDEAPIVKNLIIGTGVIAEAAALLLVASVWGSVFIAGNLSLFSVHPLAQSFGFLVLIQSILVLQPTHTAKQKEVGQKVHAGLNLLAIATFITGVVAIEINKFRQGPGSHFHSVHGYLGVIASIWFLVQYIVGFTMFAVPKLYGGEAKAKAVWKYHRASGYVLLLLLMATFTSATQTDFNKNVLGLKLWALILIVVMLVIGVYPRIKKQKLGL